MKVCIHPIATITKATGKNGDVMLRPLSRYFDEYIDQNKLLIGISVENFDIVRLELVSGIGKKRRFKFQGVNSILEAEKIVGHTLFVQADAEDKINLISKNILGYSVVTDSGYEVGILQDVMWLPNNDAYVIQSDKKEYLVPIIPEVIKKLDHKSQKIIISPMDGLLD